MNPPGKKTLPSLAMLPLSAAVLLLGLSAARADYTATILADKPSAYYPFQEQSGSTAVDLSPNGNTATYEYNETGTSPQLGVPGIDTNTLAFDGYESLGGGLQDYGYVDIPASPFTAPVASDGTDSGPFSAELWVKTPSEPASWTVPIESAQYPNGWNIYVSGADAGNGATSYFYLVMRPSVFAGVAPITFHQWYHLVVTFDGTNALMYVNGVAYGPYNASGFSPAFGSDVHIGSGQGVGWGPLNGDLTQVAFYTNVLSSAQVLTHYAVGTNEIAAPPTPPIDEGDPASITNYVGTAATFTVSADGTSPLHYQWYENSVPVGSNAPILSFISKFPADNNAAFQVVITNRYGSVTSAVATLTVYTNVNVPGQPGSITRNVGSYAAFHATAFGAEPITYQWTLSTDGGNTFTNLVGQTNDTLWVKNVQLTQNNNQYNVIVGGPFGTTPVSPATLNVVPRTEIVPLNGYSAIIVADSPVAYWLLDETNGASTAVDAVGTFDGAYTPGNGTVLYQVTNGVPKTTNSAVGLENGATVQIPFAPELNPEVTWSLETWVQPYSLGANGGDYRLVLSSEYNLYPNPYNGWYMYQQPNNTFAFVPQPLNAFISAGPIVANNWYHIVVTADGTNFNFYLNGVLATAPYPEAGFVANGAGINEDGTAGLNDGSWDNASTVIGMRDDALFNPFEGSVSDTAIYNYALTPAQVHSHYVVATKISATTVGKSLILSWPTGILESSTNVAGVFTPVTGATSPYTNIVTGSKLFFQVYVP